MSKEPVINLEFHDVEVVGVPWIEDRLDFVYSIPVKTVSAVDDRESYFTIKAVGEIARGLVGRIVPGMLIDVRGHFTEKGFVSNFIYGVSFPEPAHFISVKA